MTVALIALDPKAILEILPGPQASFRLPSGDNVGGAFVGWSGQGCALVDVTPFSPPAGQAIFGDPSYSFDGEAVVETYQTVEIPGEPPSALAQAALDATDNTAIRCFKAGVAFPPEWQAYVTALRAIVKSNSGDLPVRPPFPEGT